MQDRSVSKPAVGMSRLLVWIVLAVIAAGSMWSYVLITWPESAQALSDLYPRWYGTRELLLHGRNPYSMEVTREIQIWQRGRPAIQGEDEGRFAYPAYVIFFLAPTVDWNFHFVNILAFWLLLLLTALSVVLYLDFLNWTPPWPIIMALVVFSVGTFPAALGSRLRQLSLMSGLLVAVALVLISRKQYLWAGVALALSTIKPQLTFLLIGWALIWTLADWRMRQRLFWAGLASMVALIGSAQLLAGNWLPQFFCAIIAYAGYTDGRSILQVLFTRTGGTVAAVLVLVGVAFFCGRHRKSESHSVAFVLCTAIVLATTLVVIPTLAPHGQVLLIPGIFVLLRFRQAIWQGGRICRYAVTATMLLLSWQWVAALAVSFTAITFGLGVARRFWLVPLSTSPILPLAVAATLTITGHRVLGAVGEVEKDVSARA